MPRLSQKEIEKEINKSYSPNEDFWCISIRSIEEDPISKMSAVKLLESKNNSRLQAGRFLQTNKPLAKKSVF